MKVYLLIGQHGQYEEHKSWVVTAYINRKLALSVAKAATEASWDIQKRISDLPDTDDWWDRHQEITAKFGRKMVRLFKDSEAQPGATYHVQAIKVREKAA